MKGKGLLKVTGILMIIGGALAIIAGIIALLGVGAIVALAASMNVEVIAALLTFGAIIALASGIIELVAGILGVKNCDKPEKAGACLVMGILVVALSVIGSIFSVIGGGTLDLVGLALGLVLPVLYIIGAVKNKQSA